MINPAIVEGQVRGGVAQGIGEVLYERSAYDDEGNYLAGTFMDYLLPTASEIPVIEIDHLENEPNEEVSYRGVGEGDDQEYCLLDIKEAVAAAAPTHWRRRSAN